MDRSLDGKICIVTGATSGIGLETARGLLQRGAVVALVGRSEEKGARTLAQLRTAAADPAAPHVLPRRFSLRWQAVRQLASELAEAFPSINVLVNNAGLVVGERRLSDDGFEDDPCGQPPRPVPS